MKPQDILFIIVIIALIWRRNPKWAIVVGVISFCLSIPLFQLQIFFTAERLVMYAAGFILLGIILLHLKKS